MIMAMIVMMVMVVIVIIQAMKIFLQKMRLVNKWGEEREIRIIALLFFKNAGPN